MNKIRYLLPIFLLIIFFKVYKINTGPCYSRPIVAPVEIKKFPTINIKTIADNIEKIFNSKNVYQAQALTEVEYDDLCLAVANDKLFKSKFEKNTKQYAAKFVEEYLDIVPNNNHEGNIELKLKSIETQYVIEMIT